MQNGQHPGLGKIQLSIELEITPLAAESLGVRSLATHIQTADASILIDPGAALGFRDQHHPHPEEYAELAETRERIHTVAKSADLIVISHFHHDHFMPFFRNYAYFWSDPDDAEALYSDKHIWCKDIRSRINYSQQGRGYNFVRKARKVAQEVVYADGKATKLGNTLIRFSPAVPHGESGSKLGWIIMTAIRCGNFSMVHGSDVQGPMEKETAEWITSQHPDVLILAGPPTYLVPDRVSPKVLTTTAEVLGTLTDQIPMTIVDHHLLRDANYHNWLGPIQQRASKKGNQLMTVAEVLGKPHNQLEANRDTLYQNKPPSPTFETWVKGISKSRSRIRPPLDI
ncbi:MAG: MBL fold metallo-hydrolase [Candidatus Hermodarchaeia archaeon]|jgi:predicted metallo-beta-lactamase superfamily hydrolase